MRILSIETSCDDTAAAIVEWAEDHSSLSSTLREELRSDSNESSSKTGGCVTVLASTVSSQTIHEKWGGVVPNLASREHVKNIVPVVEETLKRAKCTPQDIDLIAVTQGPGLMPALIVGVSAAKTLALVWNKPLIGIQHLEGHIYANFLNLHNTKYLIPNTKSSSKKLEAKSYKPKATFPLLALIVSGGHTELVLMKKHFDYTILGETQDDAAGEAFDKVAKMLGLPYPGGPIVAKRADAFRNNSRFKIQDSRFNFPRPMLNSDDFDFSFSGLKTAVLYFLKKHAVEMKNEKFIDAVCYEFQEAVVDVLVAKTKKAIELYAPHTLVIAGGVSANVRLREQLQNLIDSINLEAEFPNQNKITFLTPEFAYSLDNAAMIGIAAAMRYEHMDTKQKEELMHTALTLDPDANMPLQNL
ncbi:MAG: tRNA (adenosine(37)-N6)-threonylcarbamoyltransferase complex transferase subunit TsaD [bacterium]|nr:tRNA (adenosine(37)-N6)-threonylcarbamoyltransferase complex transferase subunit TsaD [bacterium]